MSDVVQLERVDLTTHVGSELPGVQLADLTEEELQDVSRLAGERCVLFFRDQRMTLDDQLRVGRAFGELHAFPGRARDAERLEFIRVHGDADSRAVPGEGWHTDVSCDERPPALSMLRIDTVPPVGGDTVFASMYGAYESLSPALQELLLGLTAVHSGRHAGPRYGYFDPTATYPENEHPVVRVHPTSGRKALYVNSGYTARIVQLNERESDALLRLLFDHIAYGVQYQARFHWEAGSVALWDNRCTQHHATWDYFPNVRNGYRVTTVGERPVPARPLDSPAWAR